MTLPEIIAKLEAATGPDRELDCLIWTVHLGQGQPMRTVGAPTYDTPRFFCNPNPADVIWISYDLLNHALPYTASLDAALRLVPEEWFIERMGESRSRIVYKHDVHEPDGFYAEIQHISGGRLKKNHNNYSLAVAVCIAALKARSAAI